MAAKRDCYEILGINRSADEKEIKRAYRKLAKKYHPDTNSGDAQAERKFKEATEAYTILSDPEKKKLYDRFGYAAFDGSMDGYGSYDGGSTYSGFYRSRQANSTAYDGGNGRYRQYHFEGGNADDIFSGIFDDMFRRSSSKNGADIQSEVTISFEDAAFGCDKVLRLQRADGPGSMQSLQVHIPAGIDDGKSIRLRGKGMPGINGGEPGDLLLKINVMAKPGFERKGLDVYTTVSVPFTTAVFGGEALVQTIDGAVLCKIREGTQSGTKIRLKGKGVVSMKNPSVRGDQLAVVQIEVPKNLGPEARQKLREYERACGRERPGHGSAA